MSITTDFYHNSPTIIQLYLLLFFLKYLYILAVLSYSQGLQLEVWRAIPPALWTWVDLRLGGCSAQEAPYFSIISTPWRTDSASLSPIDCLWSLSPGDISLLLINLISKNNYSVLITMLGVFLFNSYWNAPR